MQRLIHAHLVHQISRKHLGCNLKWTFLCCLCFRRVFLLTVAEERRLFQTQPELMGPRVCRSRRHLLIRSVWWSPFPPYHWTKLKSSSWLGTYSTERHSFIQQHTLWHPQVIQKVFQTSSDMSKSSHFHNLTFYLSLKHKTTTFQLS